jgi:hypothetical protein
VSPAPNSRGLQATAFHLNHVCVFATYAVTLLTGAVWKGDPAVALGVGADVTETRKGKMRTVDQIALRGGIGQPSLAQCNGRVAIHVILDGDVGVGELYFRHVNGVAPQEQPLALAFHQIGRVAALAKITFTSVRS